MRASSDDGLNPSADRAEVARLELAPDICVELMRTSYQRQAFPKHAHEYFTIGVGLRGTGVLWFRGSNHLRQRGDLVVLRPDEVHTGRPAPGSALLSYLAVHVSESVLALCANAHGIRRGGTANVASEIIRDPAISAELYRVDASMRTSGVIGIDDTAVDAVARALALLVGRYANAERPAASAFGEPQVVRIVREIIDDCYADNACTSLAMLSVKCGVTPFHIVRQFTRSVGLSPHRYLVQVRVRRARELLARGIPPSFVAAMTGFADQSHLTMHFKRHVGTTPASYQRCLSPNATWLRAASHSG